MCHILYSNGMPFQLSNPHSWTEQCCWTQTSLYSWHCSFTPPFILGFTSFWCETVLTLVHVINITPSCILSSATPHNNVHSILLGKTSLKKFSCHCYGVLHQHEHSKLAPRVVTCANLGVSHEHRLYQWYDQCLKLQFHNFQLWIALPRPQGNTIAYDL